MGLIPSLTHTQEGPFRRKCRGGSYLNVTQRRVIGCLESTAGHEGGQTGETPGVRVVGSGLLEEPPRK